MKRVVKVLTGNEHGGAANSSKLLIKGIIEKVDSKEFDFRIVMLCNGSFAQEIYKMYPDKTCIFNNSEPPIIGQGLKWIKLKNLINLIIWFLISWKNLMFKLKLSRNDIIHTSNNYALVVCCLYRYFHKCTLITHWRRIGGVHNKAFQVLVSVVDIIICISESVKDSLPISWHRKSIVIYNGIDVKNLLDKGLQCKGELRKFLGLDNDTILFGTIGSFTPIKCHELLIESCNVIHKNNPNLVFKCVLIGSTPTKASCDYLQYLKHKIQVYSLEKFVDIVYDNTISLPSAVIVDFDFFVASTWFNGQGEGFGLVYIEAMTQGLPIIAIRVGAAKELITSEIGLLSVDNSVEQHSKLIEKMMDTAIRQQFNRKLIQQKAFDYDISITVNKVVNLYNKI